MSSADIAIGYIERCSACPGVLPTEGARVCPKCGKVKVTPRYADWPLHMRGYLMMKSFERRFVPGIARQKVWEDALTFTVAGQMYKGTLQRFAVSADEVYQPLLADADAWLAAGKPIPFLTL